MHITHDLRRLKVSLEGSQPLMVQYATSLFSASSMEARCFMKVSVSGLAPPGGRGAGVVGGCVRIEILTSKSNLGPTSQKPLA